MDKLLEHDFWAFSGGKNSGVIVMQDKKGRQRTLAFDAISRKHKGILTKAIIRFTKPPDLAGASFLQIQNDDRDDDRFLYLPALKRSKRVAGSQRSNSFMGTDFSFADIDRRDWREGKYSAGPDKKLAKHDCHTVVVTPKRGDSPYSKIELTIRKKNFLPLQVKMFDKAGVHLKTLTALQIKKVSGLWFISKSKMVNHREQHLTLLHFVKLKPRDDIPDTDFARQNLGR